MRRGPPADEDFRPFRGQQHRDRPADSGGSASDDRLASVERGLLGMRVGKVAGVGFAHARSPLPRTKTAAAMGSKGSGSVGPAQSPSLFQVRISGPLAGGS